MDFKKKKEKLRQELLERRSSIPEKTFLQKSDQICSRLKNLKEFSDAEIIHCYVSMNDRREVNTHGLIREMLNSGKQVVVPVAEMDSGTLKHVKLNRFEDLKPNRWGVLEPAQGEEVPVDRLELIIVPMAGGDRQKNRIGYGKGFYDRFLQGINCPAAGLLFECCLVEKIPVEPFDVQLDILITEEDLY